MSITKHVCHCALLTCTIFVVMWNYGALRSTTWDPRFQHVDPLKDYGLWGSAFLYLSRIVALLAVPQLLCNFWGLVRYNVFPRAPVLKGSPLLAPMICFRVVTRGDFPELVRNNVKRNMDTCRGVGLENFLFEVATDKPVGMEENRRVRELVIPVDYRTRTGALFKARALQFCLEDGVNMLANDEWIVHLDEETLLTENSIRGIINFVLEGKHDIGQGAITYANDGIVNWITTLADSARVADDMGKLRFLLKRVHKPLFGFKGSFVVVRVSVERDISFDNGIDGSVAEDCFFAMKASSRGYTFDFVEGEMHEKSPFTLMDIIQQRKRWLQGLLLVVHSKEIPWRSRAFLSTSVYSSVMLPLTTSCLVIPYFFPVPCPLWMDIVLSFVGAIGVYMYIFGVLKSFPRKRLGTMRYVLCIFGVVCLIPVFVVLENTAVLWGLFGKKHKFYVVQKGLIRNISVVNA